jgi:hypothetical protein
VISPPEGRLYAVRIVLRGAGPEADPAALEKTLRLKSAEGLRRGCADLRVTVVSGPDAEVPEVSVTATVNEWNSGSAAMRVAGLLIIKAGAGWDTLAMSVSAEPVRSRPDSIEQGGTSTNAA